MDIKETEKAIKEILEGVTEPDLNDSITALDLVEVEQNGDNVLIKVFMHNPAMHARKKMEEQCNTLLSEKIPGLKFQVETIPLPPENKRPAHLRTVLKGVKHIVAIASGKGGVGKSTVTANLAVTLRDMGFKVGIVDADIYGPSMPVMFGVENGKPALENRPQGQILIPVESHGIKLLSIGFFADMTQAVAWRGPMAVKALKQLFTDADWEGLDFLLVDLPPGTGDIHLSLVQDFPLSGAVIVSTPQQVALADASRAISMFRLPSVNIPVLGIIENMAWFTPEELPGNRYYIFGKGGAKKLAEEVRAPFLGEIPLVQSVREAGDAGKPAAGAVKGPVAESFTAITENLLRLLRQPVNTQRV